MFKFLKKLICGEERAPQVEVKVEPEVIIEGDILLKGVAKRVKIYENGRVEWGAGKTPKARCIQDVLDAWGEGIVGFLNRNLIPVKYRETFLEACREACFKEAEKFKR